MQSRLRSVPETAYIVSTRVDGGPRAIAEAEMCSSGSEGLASYPMWSNGARTADGWNSLGRSVLDLAWHLACDHPRALGRPTVEPWKEGKKHAQVNSRHKCRALRCCNERPPSSGNRADTLRTTLHVTRARRLRAGVPHLARHPFRAFPSPSADVGLQSEGKAALTPAGSKAGKT